MRILKKNNIEYFFYNGGNDSMDTCNKVSIMAKQEGLNINVIGVPKTIDNDLGETDHCPGFGSAAKYIATSARELDRDAEALNIHVIILEAMGRNAGWIAGASALAKDLDDDGPHLVLLPEIPFNEEQFLESVSRIYKEKGRCLVVASEGLCDKNGDSITKPKHATDVDGFGHALPGNVSYHLAGLISNKLNQRCRSEKPGLLGRVSTHLQSSVDRDEAYDVGVLAVKSAVEGKTGYMVAIDRVSDDPYRAELRLVELEKVANVEHKIPRDFINEQGDHVTEEFINYCRPLIGGPLVDHARLSKNLNIL